MDPALASVAPRSSSSWVHCVAVAAVNMGLTLNVARKARNLKENDGRRTVCISYDALFVTFALLVTGLAFAGLSLSAFWERCL